MAVDDSYTKSLLHFDGADGSTTFTDESGKVWTAGGNAQIDTAQSKFGTGAGLFDGTGDYIDTPDHDDFTVGSGDWTVDFWFRVPPTATEQYIFGQRDSAPTTAGCSMFGYISAAGVLRIQVASGTTWYYKETGTALDNTAWHHYAGIRYGNGLYVAADGTLSAALDVTGVTINNSTYKFAIGRCGEYTGAPLNGHIDEFRFSKGIARWTANFTPPTTPYTPHPTATYRNQRGIEDGRPHRFYYFINGLYQPTNNGLANA